MQIRFILDAPEDWPELRARLMILLRALYELDCLYLRENPTGVPELYSSGIRYRMEPILPNGQPREDWQTIPETVARGEGDCEDVACYYAAWQTVRVGRKCAPIAILQEGALNGYRLIHIVAEFPDGTREDPSRVLRAIESRENRRWQ